MKVVFAVENQCGDVEAPELRREVVVGAIPRLLVEPLLDRTREENRLPA
jgi:hypothetical protein